jgi:hypothetical protein
MVYYVLYSSTRHTPSGLLLSNPGNIPQRSSLFNRSCTYVASGYFLPFAGFKLVKCRYYANPFCIVRLPQGNAVVPMYRLIA